jgi:alpha-N-acetylglucosaminidase
MLLLMGTKRILLVITLMFVLFTTGGQHPMILPPGDAAPGVTPGKAVEGLLKRLLPGYANRNRNQNPNHFEFKRISSEEGKDVFEIESNKGKIVIGGNNGVSMASGLNWYLKHYCRCHVSLNNRRLNLPEPLPVVKEKVRLVSPFKYRNFFNYCTFSYTMAWWDWERWEKMIDYMALNGINMPLAITGQEAVWQEVFRELGLNRKQVEEFIVGPAYLPWGWMGNIDGLGGPLPQHWIDCHARLQQKIVARERELGMTPILQGFTGHVPPTLKEVYPNARIHRTTRWAGMPGTWFLDPQDPLFLKIGRSFITKQTHLFGTDHLYCADCFNEINPHTRDLTFITNVGKSVYRGMQAGDPEATWVFQGWFLYFQADFWKAPQTRALLEAVPGTDPRMLGLDLWGEEQPVWNKTNAFYGKPWIWNVFCLSSQNVNMSGDLDTMQKELITAVGRNHSGKLQGIGMMMEGFGYNPIVQEFILEKAWKPEAVDLSEWTAAYAARRYGSQDPRLKKAWQLLLEGPYSRTARHESIICLTPRFSRFRFSDPDRFGVGYDAYKVVKACQLLLNCSEEIGDLETYRFDLTHVTREMLSNLANLFYYFIIDAYERKDAHALAKHSEIFLQLIRDMDELLGTDKHFLLGKWIAAARKWGTNSKEKRLYEWNARTIVTMWEPAKKSRLRDYASKQWNGLLKDFYLPRWQCFLDRLYRSLIDNTPFDKKKFFRDVKEMELAWIRQTDRYPSEPGGDTLEAAHRLFKKYIIYYK